MISRLLLLGATGDLAGRFLLPALARLLDSGQLPNGLQVVGAAAQDGDDTTFREHVEQRLARYAEDVPVQVRRQLLSRLRYRVVDLADPATVAAAVDSFGSGDGSTDPAVAVYLALPPATFPAAIDAVRTAHLPAGSRIAVEKPFGNDLRSAVALNAQLAPGTGGAGAPAVFRVDHALGMPTMGDLLHLHGVGGALASVWNGEHVEQVDVLWEETLGLEGRADFYDRAGVVKDVLQNHLLQVLVAVALEVPADPSEQQLHDTRLDVLRSVRPLSTAEVAARTRRARYTAGRLVASGAPVPDYTAEQGVDPGRGTETFAEMVLEVDRPRWAGTRFVLRAGKALAVPRKGVLLHLRLAEDLPDGGGARVRTDRVWIGLDGARDPDEGVLTLVTPPVDGELAAYTRVLGDVLTGSTALSVGAEESEQAWRVVEPVLAAWARGIPPLLQYPAGSVGPG